MPESQETHFAELITEEALEDGPYQIYRRLQDEQPVCWVPKLGLWFVTRWIDVVNMCKRHEIFSAQIPSSALTRTIGSNVLHSDGSYHDRLRSIIEPAFRPGVLSHYPNEVIEPLAQDIVESFGERERLDLVAEFAHPLSVHVLKHHLGIEVDDQTLLRWSDGLAAGASNFTADPERQAYADMVNCEINDEIATYLSHPSKLIPGTTLQVMASAEEEGLLSRAQILSNFKLLIIGGLKTAGDLISVALFALLHHPDQLSEVLRRSDLIGSSIEEAARWLSPVGTVTRRTICNCTLSGVQLPPNAVVAGILAAANRDSRVFVNPDNFDIHRRERNHLAFAAGPHTCIGALLGRYEASVGLRILFENVSTLKLDTRIPVKVRGWEFRGPLALNCVFQKKNKGFQSS